MYFGDLRVVGLSDDLSLSLFSNLQKKIRDKVRFTKMAVSSMESWVNIFDARTYELLTKITTHSKVINLQFIDENTIALPCGSSIYVHNTNTGAELFRLNGHKDQMFAIDSCRTTLYTGSHDHSVRAWDLQTRKEIWYTDLERIIYVIKVISSDRILAGGSNQSTHYTVYLLDTRNGDIERRIDQHANLLYGISVTREYIITVGFDKVIVWDKNFKEIRNFAQGPIFSSSEIEDGMYAMSHNGSELGIWNIHNGACISRCLLDVGALAYPGIPGRLIIGTMNTGEVFDYNVHTKERVLIDGSMKKQIRSIKFI